MLIHWCCSWRTGERSGSAVQNRCLFLSETKRCLGAQLLQSTSKSLCLVVLRFLDVFVRLDLTLEHQNEAQEVHGVLFLVKEDNTTNDQR